MKTDMSMLAFAGAAAAHSLLPRALPAGVQAPSTSGFINSTVHPSRGGLAVCVSGFVEVKASAENLKFNYTLPSNQSQVTETFVEFVTAGSPFTDDIMAGYQNVSGTYTLGASYCTPANDTKPSEVHLATHGIGFDRYYWDFAPGYSYVDVAVENGYGVFFYDRLGVGQSNKSDPINTVQAPLEVAIDYELAAMLRGGDFSNTTFSKIVGIGHSFGSIITQAVTSKYPTAFDAAILTGFSVNETAVPAFISAGNLAIAVQNQPYRFSSLPLAYSNGYLVTANDIGNQIQFFRAPNFDPLILAEAGANKGTVTIGEFFSLSAVTASSNTTKPVAVINGDNDLPFCFGNCTYPTNQAQNALTTLYPKLASNQTGVYLAPNTGHGVNLHYTANAAFDYIMEFLQLHGL